MCDNSSAIIPPLSLEYYEAKIQMLSVFSWKLEMPRYVEIQIFLFLKVRSKKSVKLLPVKLWREIREIQLDLENVDTYDMKKTS